MMVFSCAAAVVLYNRHRLNDVSRLQKLANFKEILVLINYVDFLMDSIMLSEERSTSGCLLKFAW